MDKNQFSVDDILLEMEGEKKGKTAPSVDVDALLQSILNENEYVKKAASAPKEPEEAPTKTFKRGTIASALTRNTASFRTQKAPVSSEPTGGIRIDVDGIRNSDPAPKPIPADPGAASFVQETPSVEGIKTPIKFHQEKEKTFEDSLLYAPAFSAFEAIEDTEHAGIWEKRLVSEKVRLTRKGIFLLLFGAAALLLTAVLELLRKGPGFTPTPLLPLGTLLFTLAAGAVAFDLLKGGFTSLFRFEPDRRSVSCVCYALCTIQQLLAVCFPNILADGNVQLYGAFGALSLAVCCFSLTGTLAAALRNVSLFHSEGDKYIPQILSDNRLAGDFTRGLVEDMAVPAINRKATGLKDFLRLSLSADKSDVIGRNFSIAGPAVGLVVGLIGYLLSRSSAFALTLFTAVTAAFTPFTAAFLTSAPLNSVSKLLSKVGSMAAGEKCVKEYGDVNALLVDAKSLFPPSVISLNGIKTFEGMRIDEAILDAAAVLHQSNSIFSDVFLNMLSGNRLLRKAEHITYEDTMGICAWVNDRRILIGNRHLLANHGIRMPSEDYERRLREDGNEFIYLATGGELTAVFIVSIHVSMQTESAVQMLEDNGIGLAVKTVDAVLTPELLSRLFHVSPECFKMIPERLFERFDTLSESVLGKQAKVVNNGTFVSLACSLSAAKRLRVMFAFADILWICGMVVTGLLILLMSVLNAFVLFSALALCGLSFFWLMIDLLIQKWFRL